MGGRQSFRPTALINGPTSNRLVLFMNFGFAAVRSLVPVSARASRRAFCLLALGIWVAASTAVQASAADELQAQRTPPYRNEKLAEGPWSIHIVRMDLHNPD